MQAATQLLAIPDGEAGTRATLALMARLVREARKRPEVRLLAQRIVRVVVGHKNFRGQIAALHRWVQRYIQYVADVRGVETVQTPTKTLELGSGDCDDQATLLAALAESIGFTARFVAIKTDLDPRAPFVHVYSEVLVDGWVPLETTEPWPAGARPRDIAASIIQEIPQ